MIGQKLKEGLQKLIDEDFDKFTKRLLHEDSLDKLEDNPELKRTFLEYMMKGYGKGIEAYHNALTEKADEKVSSDNDDTDSSDQ